MTSLDRFIQRARISKAAGHIPSGARVLDIGSADGALFRQVKHIGSGIGIDPLLERQVDLGAVQLIPGLFPSALPTREPFDVITMLAVLEHIPRTAQPELARNCAAFLRSGGRLIVTVPSPAVDTILDWLRAARLIDGMSLEQHYGFTPAETRPVFGSAGLSVIAQERFQFGLNNLFVFVK
jgi:SAM-dependent methyltransferase